MKTAGHYFVHNLNGNPITGWVYVDVVGNGADRIRQDVYQDSNGQHKYRRWFGNYWTGWDGAASQNDLNSVKTEVTASVKNLGDRITTEVNSITTRQNNFENEAKEQHSNDVELVRKSDFEDGSKGNWTVQAVVSATNPAPPNASFAKPWYQMEKPANNTENSSWLAKPSIRRQNPQVENKISELNTKWDVANGQIQGKVTETQVNNILNGKGYATQSWAQTMFQMKSDSITLQAVRDNITNGIQNQVNVINKKIDTQTLDSANIDNMRTQGHYFVKNLTGNPIGGWVYVDVNYADQWRIRQDVYQDVGGRHVYRRLNGSSWTEWTTDVNNKNVVSQINITPDQIKIASNKIVIDGNTDIHGKLNVPEVELQGKSGVIGLNGSKGILIASRNGDTIGEFQTRITKFGMDLLTSTNNRKEVMGGITTGYNTNNNNFNGISIVLDTQQKLGAPHGGDFFSIGNTTWSDLEGNRTWNKAMDYDASQQIHGGGFGWYEHSTLYGDGRRISVDGAHDPLWLSGTKFSSSSQPDLFQPTIRAGWSDQVYGDSGIGFLWNQLKPFGNVDVSDVREIWFNGIKFIFGWASHPNMWNNAKQPAFYRVGDDGSVTAGIAFTPGSTWDLGSGARNITQGLMVLQNHGWM